MSDIVDLEDIVKQWAWQQFEYQKTKEQAKISTNLLRMTIDWRKVKFAYDPPQYDITPIGSGPGGKMEPQCAFKTTFSNNTNMEQEYSFKTERRTSSSATVAVEKGFSASMEVGIKLQTPGEIASANAGFKKEFSVLNIEEETVEEEMAWGVDTAIRVSPGREVTAELLLTEAQSKGGFKMRVTMKGRVMASIENMAANNSLLTVIMGEIHEIILREMEKGLKNFRVDKGRVVVTEVAGKVQFQFGVEQNVIVTEQPIQRGKLAISAMKKSSSPSSSSSNMKLFK